MFTTLVFNKTPVKLQLDCGAAANIIPEDIYQSIFEDPQHKLLEKCNTQLIMFNNTVMSPIGKLSIATVNPKNQENCKLDYLIVEPEFTTDLKIDWIWHLLLKFEAGVIGPTLLYFSIQNHIFHVFIPFTPL